MNVQIHKVGDPEIVLSSDLAAEFPLYIYVSDNSGEVLYGQCLRTLLEDSRVPKPLSISEDGVSFLLQASVVPPPRTVYKNLFILSAGDRLRIKTNGKKLELEFSYEFPFSNVKRLTFGSAVPDEKHILKIIAEAVISRIDPVRDSYLFHSAGKDSNMVALALAEAGWQKKVILLSHQSEGPKDESVISKSIADKLGFSHQCLSDNAVGLRPTDMLDYFKNMTLPVVDVVTLAYPLYSNLQCPGLRRANVIDGGGNDIYLGTLPSRRDGLMFSLSRVFAPMRPWMGNWFDSESFFNPLTRTKTEWCGFGGFLFSEAKRIFPGCTDLRPYFIAQDTACYGSDEIDFKTRFLAGVVAAEMHIRKFRIAADVWQANAVLPFANENVAAYLSKLPENYLFTRDDLKNKLIFRKILKERIGLDSDKIGKLGYSFDFWHVLQVLQEEVRGQILDCKWWSRVDVTATLKRLWDHADKPASAGVRRARVLILRLYLLSAWANQSRYLKP